MSEIGLYIHIPFCQKKCLYCDFVSSRANDDDINQYIDALICEIKSYKNTLKNDKIRTLYIGGGTPSFIDQNHIKRIMDTIYDNFNCNFLEATIECNPESVNEEKLKCYKDLGLNRISLGVQSLSNNLLHIIGRIHDNNRAIDAISLAKMYFDNVSCDLMIGLPYQSQYDVEYALKTLCDMDIQHISVYGLTVERGTPMYDMVENGMLYINEDFTADLYDFTVNYLKGRNYSRYEISNFSKEGYESKHNLSYWQRIPYVGFGVSAYSFYDNKRFNNVSYKSAYINKITNGDSPVENVEEVSIEDAKKEMIMLSLRTKYGLDIKKYNSTFNCDFLTDKKQEISKNMSFLHIDNNILTIKDNYYYISNSILSDLI